MDDPVEQDPAAVDPVVDDPVADDRGAAVAQVHNAGL